MNSLLRALYRYALDTRLDTYLRPEREELLDNERMCRLALERLAPRLDGEGALRLECYVSGRDILESIRQEAVFASGLSLGLSLAALGQFPE